MARDGVSIFSFNSGTAPAASLIMELFQHSSPGGLLWCFGDLPPRPQTGIIRPVHRAHLCHANSGEIPLFESHLQRWNMFLSKHHSQAPPSVEQTLVPPAMWKRSLFGSLLGNIKRSFHVFRSLSSVTLQAEHIRRKACPLLSNTVKISCDIIYICSAFSRTEKFQPAETYKKSGRRASHTLMPVLFN